VVGVCRAVCCSCCLCCVLFWFGCLVVWLCPRFCGVVASCVSRVAGVCWCCCSSVSVGSVLFWVVRCFVVLLVAVRLLVGCRGCVALSAFLLLVCFAPPGWFMLLFLVVGLLVLLSPLFCVGSCRFVTIWFLTQNATLVGWLCGVACAYL